MKQEEAIYQIARECAKAINTHPHIQSQHEGYAIIKEELDELWEQIRKIHNLNERNENIRREAIQVAAMAMRFLIDLY